MPAVRPTENPTESPADPHFQEAADLRLAVFRLARRLRAERGANQLSDAQHVVVAVLSHEGPMSLGELAARERVSAPSMNRTVNCLEEQGLVQRVADSSDGRKVSVQITEAGSTLVTEVKRRRTNWLASAMHELTPDEQRSLNDATAALNKLASL